MRAALTKFNLLGIVLLCLSGATPVPPEPECPAAEPILPPLYRDPMAAAATKKGCPTGSCDRRPC